MSCNGSPSSAARERAEKVQVVEEVPGNASVADDTDGRNAGSRYLSHRSGPFGSESQVCVVTVRVNRRFAHLTSVIADGFPGISSSLVDPRGAP
jgi:hypothetical protein